MRKLLPYLLFGIGIGALIHGYAPTELVAAIGGRSNLLAVPLVVLIAVPMYSNAAGTIPIVQALLGKGMPLGTTLAFMMAVTAISLPELVILRRVMKPQLLAIFIGVVTTGIVAVGYMFNFLVSWPRRSRRCGRIEVLGSGCPNCQRLEANAREAVAMAGVEAEVLHVTDFREIAAYGIMSTPGLVIDGKVVSAGRIPSAGDIALWLSE